MKLRIPFLLALLSIAIAAAAPAVIIDSGDGTGNTSAPSPDPGWGSWWNNVGTCNGLSCVYLSDGWVLTANHVGAGDATFGGVTYPWLVGSDVRLHNPDTSLADLRVFRLQFPYPPLPDLPIATSTATSSSTHPLYLVGDGRNRGATTTWDPCGPGSYNGYLWGPGTTMRWGTNRVEVAQYFEPGFGTWVFGTKFDSSGFSVTAYEAQGATGDSGGATFAWNGTSYELAGILIGIGTLQTVPTQQCPNVEYQPPETAIYQDQTYAADLSIYHDEIVSTMPEPAGGLWAGAALIAWLSAGTRRACRGTGCAASSPPRA